MDSQPVIIFPRLTWRRLRIPGLPATVLRGTSTEERLDPAEHQFREIQAFPTLHEMLVRILTKRATSVFRRRQATTFDTDQRHDQLFRIA